MIVTLLVFLVIIAVLVTIHEFGHFIVAKKVGVFVKEFAIGFKPRLWAKKIGETEYAINAIPLGGYVRLYGEGENEKGKRSLLGRSLSERFYILVAGAMMNILLGWLILTVLFIVGFQPIFPGVEKDPFVNIPAITKVDSVSTGSPAYLAGLRPDDVITQVDGQYLDTTDFVSYVNTKKGQTVILNVTQANGSQIIIQAIPRANPPAGEGALGVGLVSESNIKISIFKAPLAAFYETGRIIGLSVAGFANFVKGLVIHQQVSDNVTGLIGVGVLTGAARRLGFAYLMQLVVLITVGLGVVNLMPILPLDGGHIAAVIYEKIVRRPLGEKQLNWLAMAGLAFVVLLFVAVTYKDVIRFDLIGRIF